MLRQNEASTAKAYLDEPARQQDEHGRWLLVPPDERGRRRPILVVHREFVGSDIASALCEFNHGLLSGRIEDTMTVVRNVVPPNDSEQNSVEGRDEVVKQVQVREQKYT